MLDVSIIRLLWFRNPESGKVGSLLHYVCSFFMGLIQTSPGTWYMNRYSVMN